MIVQAQMLERSLVGFAAVLAALFVYQAVAAPPHHDLPKLYGAPGQETPRLETYDIPPVNNFAQVDDRPLFSPLRKPIEVAPELPPPPPPPQVSLIGIIAQGQRRIALLRDPKAPLALRVDVGSKIEGWEVVEIAEDRVVLSANAVKHEVSLNTSTTRQRPPSTPGDSAVEPAAAAERAAGAPP
jgi:hypothetical protein